MPTVTIDQSIFDQPWLREAGFEANLAFVYIITKADRAGVCKLDWGLLPARFGLPVNSFDRDAIIESLAGRVEKFGEDGVFVVDYIQWQCFGGKKRRGALVDPQDNYRKSVLSGLIKHDLQGHERLAWAFLAPGQPLASPSADSSQCLRTSTRVNTVVPPINESENPQPKKTGVLSESQLESFNRFWDAFGDKRGRSGAVRSWFSLKPDTETAKSIIAGAKKYKVERIEILARGWTPKMAQGWLSDKRWEDDPMPSGPIKGQAPLANAGDWDNTPQESRPDPRKHEMFGDDNE